MKPGHLFQVMPFAPPFRPQIKRRNQSIASKLSYKSLRRDALRSNSTLGSFVPSES